MNTNRRTNTPTPAPDSVHSRAAPQPRARRSAKAGGHPLHHLSVHSGDQRELWDLYDKNGKPLGRTAYRGDCLAEGEHHLVVQIWTRRPDGRYLIQKRAATLKTLPGVWTTTAGSVVAGEDCVTGAARELAEEIGVHADPQELHQAFHRVGGDAIEFAWLLESDVPPGDIRLQKEEVAEVKWATAQEIQKMVDEGSFFDYGSEYFTAVFAWNNDE